MNQILVHEKVYVTPQIRSKRMFFKIEFILSILVIIAVSLYGIYAAYDRNKSEAVSKEILEEMGDYQEKEKVEEQAIIIALNKQDGGTVDFNDIETSTVEIEKRTSQKKEFVAKDGTKYYTNGKISIPQIDCEYPILSSNTSNYETLLKIAPVKFYGADPNEVGNLCIVGHNYKNSQFFSKVPTLENGDKIEITDNFGDTVEYEVYDKYITVNTDTSCTSQLTNGKREVTLITCTNANDEHRVIVKAKEVNSKVIN